MVEKLKLLKLLKDSLDIIIRKKGSSVISRIINPKLEIYEKLNKTLDEEDEEVVEEDFPGKRDMEQHKSDLSEERLKEIIAHALKTRG